jgi:Zn-finger nucleic acid-binding protein
MLACPLDQTPLTYRTLGRFHLPQCATCSGLWLPQTLTGPAIGARVHIPPTFQRRTTRACPEDGSLLVPLLLRNISVDVCALCGGIWLDAGEWERVRSTSLKGVRPKKNHGGYALEALDFVGDGVLAVLELLITGL